jgi:hypothetical protein
MKSALLGEDTSGAEVGNVSRHGFWLLVSGREMFLSFKDFPWFADAPIAHLVNVQLPHPHHLYWPELDVDLSLESIENPEGFPLVSRVQHGKPVPRRAGIRSRRSGARSARETRRR